MATATTRALAAYREALDVMDATFKEHEGEGGFRSSPPPPPSSPPRSPPLTPRGLRGPPLELMAKLLGMARQLAILGASAPYAHAASSSLIKATAALTWASACADQELEGSAAYDESGDEWLAEFVRVLAYGGSDGDTRAWHRRLHPQFAPKTEALPGELLNARRLVLLDAAPKTDATLTELRCCELRWAETLYHAVNRDSE